MIEIQIKDEKTYNALKVYASYSSDITRVCSFGDGFEPTLKEYGLTDIYRGDDAKLTSGSLPTLTIVRGNVMKLEGAPADMLAFVGVRSEFDPTIPLRNIEEVGLLVKNKLVKPTDSFNALYSKMGYRAKISDLVCAKVKFSRFGGSLLDFIDGDLTINSLKVNDPNVKPIPLKQVKVRVTGTLEAKDKFDQVMCKMEDSSGSNIILKFYNRPAILKSLLFPGNIFTIACPKITEAYDETLQTIDPIITPAGLDYISTANVGPKSRQIPADLWRNAYFEFMFRYNRE